MHVLRTAVDAWRWRVGAAGLVGFVPTMGALHAGHVALLRRARADNQAVVASIFVNPLQFGPDEDFDRYPRSEARDLEILRGEGVDVAFVPSPDEVFPPGYETWVECAELGSILEGKARPGHFRGVTTVVARLFGIVRPNRTYFGWKDAQQLMVVRRMTMDLAMGIEVVGVETVRERDGLACSSRNAYLTASERRSAPALYRALCAAAAAYAAGERAGALEMLQENMTRTPMRLEYARVLADDVTGIPRLVVAARLGKVRLIDNVPLSAAPRRTSGGAPPPHRGERRRRPRGGGGAAGRG